MKDKKTADIPFYAHEAEMARMERINRRLLVATVSAAALLIINNIVWFVATYLH